jgi:hypothetical protein
LPPDPFAVRFFKALGWAVVWMVAAAAVMLTVWSLK